jgi:hypothetical protein
MDFILTVSAATYAEMCVKHNQASHPSEKNLWEHRCVKSMVQIYKEVNGSFTKAK